MEKIYYLVLTWGNTSISPFKPFNLTPEIASRVYFIIIIDDLLREGEVRGVAESHQCVLVVGK